MVYILIVSVVVLVLVVFLSNRPIKSRNVSIDGHSSFKKPSFIAIAYGFCEWYEVGSLLNVTFKDDLCGSNIQFQKTDAGYLFILPILKSSVWIQNSFLERFRDRYKCRIENCYRSEEYIYGYVYIDLEAPDDIIDITRLLFEMYECKDHLSCVYVDGRIEKKVAVETFRKSVNVFSSEIREVRKSRSEKEKRKSKNIDHPDSQGDRKL